MLASWVLVKAERCAWQWRGRKTRSVRSEICGFEASTFVGKLGDIVAGGTRREGVRISVSLQKGRDVGAGCGRLT